MCWGLVSRSLLVWPGWNRPLMVSSCPAVCTWEEHTLLGALELTSSRPSLSQTLDWFRTTRLPNFDTVGSFQSSTIEKISYSLLYSIPTPSVRFPQTGNSMLPSETPLNCIFPILFLMFKASRDKREKISFHMCA